MGNYNVIYFKDVGNEDYIGSFNIIKEKNEYLYKNIMIYLQKKDSPGIRDDVFDVIIKNIDKILLDSQFAFQLTFLLGNFRISPDYYSWFIDYYSSSPAVDINNFIIVLSESVEKGIPLKDLMERFEECGKDFLGVFEYVDHYDPEEKTDKEEVDEDSGKGEIVEADNKAQIVPAENRENIASVFGELYSVMSSKDIEGTSTINVQNKFNGHIAQFQTLVNDITAFSTNLCHEWEKDKEEITKLKTLISLMQKSLIRYQESLYEEREKNNRLMEKIKEAEKLKMHLENQKKKVRELEQLSLESDGIFTDE